MVRLDERLARGEVILIDGGMGTELQLRGVPMDRIAWSGLAQLSHPEVVRGLHEDYIRAGADVIIANSFASSRHVLEPGGYGDHVAEANRRAVALALEARDRVADRPVAVAGSMSHALSDEKSPYPRHAGYTSRDWRDPEVLRATYREQAELLAESGVDLIALEMFQGEELSEPAVAAALATGLPVWLGTSVGHPDARGVVPTFNHPSIAFADAVRRMVRPGLQAVIVMHSEVEDTARGLDLVKACWSGPRGAYPDTGHYEPPLWVFSGRISPDGLARAALGWVGQGAQIIGGCCGVGPEHIRRLRDVLPDHVP
jgi:S-methylmethionine-dependent homocysteine/selenocysteine methylase